MTWAKFLESSTDDERWYRVREMCLNNLPLDLQPWVVVTAANTLEGDAPAGQKHLAWMNAVATALATSGRW